MRAGDTCPPNGPAALPPGALTRGPASLYACGHTVGPGWPSAVDPGRPGKRRCGVGRLLSLWLASLLWLALVAAGPVQAAEVRIFDAHIHYSHDAWDNLPAKEAVALLRKAGLKRAMVSSSNDEGTQRLLAEAPDLIVPELRPYRARGQ